MYRCISLATISAVGLTDRYYPNKLRRLNMVWWIWALIILVIILTIAFFGARRK
ncbi:MAG: hypothetical protein GX631_01040 [Dehalococcoidales bacterium]|nr:hypothetical protein [Dehalococcoidales bacterium]